MNEEKQIEEKNCKECLHFEACCKWTDFPKQIGFPVCRKFTPTNTNLHQPCESVQDDADDIGYLLLLKGLSLDTVYPDDCEKIGHILYNAGYRKQSEGEWIDSLKGYCQCSNCRTSFETLPTTFLFKLNNRFCRHCGAKMKGGAE